MPKIQDRTNPPNPAHVDRKAISDTVFANMRFAVLGSAITAASALACWRSTGEFTPLAVAVLTTLTVILRVGVAMLRERSWRSWHDEAYTAGATAYLLCNGALAIWAFVFTDDPFLLTVTLIVSLTNSLSIALHFFALEKAVKIQVVSVLAPLTAALAWRGGYFLFAAATQVLMAWFVYASAARLRAILMSEITYRRRSDEVARQFKFAVDNMSHGMCMIDSDTRVVVSNTKLAEYFGLSPARSLQGVRFTALIRLARRRGALDRGSIERLLDCFDTARESEIVARSEISGGDGRVFDITLKRHDEGGWVLVVQDVTDQRQARKALDFAARFDAVTNLPNRRSFEAKLAEALAAARESEARTEVLFLDLDGFKQINDTLGHKIGDRVLADSASRLREMMGEGEYVSRWGGDEFVVLRRGESDGSAQRFAEGLIRELSRPSWIEGAEIVVGATVGIAVCIGGAIGMDTLLQQADMALYSAKREARGSCRLYEDSMSEKARERRLLELDLQAALASRTFELQYQPIVDIDSGDLVSFEALARWRHPVRGAVSPGLFVPILEDLNLMNAFGAWALQRACEDAARWPAPVRIGVNVSCRQLDTLVGSVRRALAATGLAPERLELEITETAALAAGDAIGETLDALRQMGVRIALDDFGTGFSSLSHLMRLPLDKVKIDRSFTQQLGQSRKADVLVANIARLSSQLGMRITFEGVETVDQLERARALAVAAEGQGWLFGKPAPAADLQRFFERKPASRVA